MKNKTIGIFIVYIILISSCKGEQPQYCTVNSLVENKFSYHITYMKENYTNNQIITGQMIRSIYFLSSISSINSNVQFGDITLYKNFSDYQEDISKWERWYEKNKCNITVSFIDSLEKSVIESTLWIDSPYNSPTDTIEY